MKEFAIVNIAVASYDSWYHRGQMRLRHSLESVGALERCDLVFSRRETAETISPYSDKVLSMKRAAEMGYKKILWLDCSITAIRPIDDMLNWIEKEGYYMYRSGYNACQTASDAALKFYNISRDEAEKHPECASNVVGINLENEKGYNLYLNWINSVNNEILTEIKFPNESQRLIYSEDKRFYFPRSDQSCISLSSINAGCSMQDHNHFVCRNEGDFKPTESVIFMLKGGDY